MKMTSLTILILSTPYELMSCITLESKAFNLILRFLQRETSLKFHLIVIAYQGQKETKGEK